MEQLDLSISLVTYKNDKKVLTDTIQSVLSSVGLNWKLYIIDNSPTDDIREWYNDERIEYYFNNKNIGFGAAHNIIMKDDSKLGRYHLVLNPDIKFESTVLHDLMEYMDNNRDVGNVLPKVYYTNGSLAPVCKLLPRPQDWFIRWLIPVKSWRQRATKRYQMLNCTYNIPMNIPYLSGCFMFLRKKVIQDIGVFDERYFMYAEDVDYSRRIHKKFKTMYYPIIEIEHYAANEGHTNLRLMFIQIKSCIYYLNKWGWFFDNERTTMNDKAIGLYFKKSNFRD